VLEAELVNPFLESALAFLKNELNVEVTRGELSLKSSKLTRDEINVVISVTGDAQGTVVYSMSERTAKRVAAMLIGEHVPVFDEMAESAIAEMGNIIAGQATIGLEERGLNCRLSPPTIIAGKGAMISTKDAQGLVIPLKLAFGSLEICVALTH